MEKDKSRKRSECDRRDRDKHRSSRDASDDHHRHHRSRSDRDSKSHNHRSRGDRSPDPRDDREASRDRRERSYEREGSRERSRAKRMKSEEREDVVERRHKRKERERSRDGGVDDEDSKRARILDERKERKRFDDRRVKEEVDGKDAGELERSNEGNVIAGEVKVKKEELEDDEGFTTAQNGGAPVGNHTYRQPLQFCKIVSESTPALSRSSSLTSNRS